MLTTITVRLALACTLIASLACAGPPGTAQERPPGEATTTTTEEGTMNQAEQDRRMDYIEFAATDVQEAKRFYAEVFGWEFTDYGPDYSSFTDGRMNGGFRLEPEVTAGGPLVVLYSTNLEEIQAKVREAGGRIVRETFEFPGGRRFHFTDPGGNELAIWSDR
jgi:predicted enzyme related to lactoylglutathione lyase